MAQTMLFGFCYMPQAIRVEDFSPYWVLDRWTEARMPDDLRTMRALGSSFSEVSEASLDGWIPRYRGLVESYQFANENYGVFESDMQESRSDNFERFPELYAGLDVLSTHPYYCGDHRGWTAPYLRELTSVHTAHATRSDDLPWAPERIFMQRFAGIADFGKEIWVTQLGVVAYDGSPRAPRRAQCTRGDARLRACPGRVPEPRGRLRGPRVVRDRQPRLPARRGGGRRPLRVDRRAGAAHRAAIGRSHRRLEHGDAGQARGHDCPAAFYLAGGDDAGTRAATYDLIGRLWHPQGSTGPKMHWL